MFLNALLVSLLTFLCVITGYHFPNMMLDRPIFLGPLIGLALGDFAVGCVIGAQLELVFMGVVFVGSATSADTASSTAIAVSLAILNGLSVNEAISVAIPIGYLCALVIALEPALGELFTPIIDRLLAKDDYKGWTIVGHLLSFIELSLRSLFVFFMVMFGGDVISSVVSGLPEFILTGVNAAGAILPVVGLAILVSQLWDKKTALYFVFGFFVMKYLSLDIMFLAIIAVFIALRDVFSFLENRKKPATAEAAPQLDDKEDFFK